MYIKLNFELTDIQPRIRSELLELIGLKLENFSSDKFDGVSLSLWRWEILIWVVEKQKANNRRKLLKNKILRSVSWPFVSSICVSRFNTWLFFSCSKYGSVHGELWTRTHKCDHPQHHLIRNLHHRNYINLSENIFETHIFHFFLFPFDCICKISLNRCGWYVCLPYIDMNVKHRLNHAWININSLICLYIFVRDDCLCGTKWKYCQKECIPVGWVPPAAVAVRGVSTRHPPRTRHPPPVADPLDQASPWKQTIPRTRHTSPDQAPP